MSSAYDKMICKRRKNLMTSANGMRSDSSNFPMVRTKSNPSIESVWSRFNAKIGKYVLTSKFF